MNRDKVFRGLSWFATGAFATLAFTYAGIAGVASRQSYEVMEKYNQEISEFKTTEEYNKALCLAMVEIESMNLTDAEKEKNKSELVKDKNFARTEYARTLNSNELEDFAEAIDAEEQNKSKAIAYMGLCVAFGCTSAICITGTFKPDSPEKKEIEMEM